MKLLTQKIKKQLPPMLTTEDIPCREKTFVCKFFNPMGPQTWYVCEGAPTCTGEDFEFFGMVDLGMGQEWGYFRLSELESIGYSTGVGIERDIYFENEPSASYMEEGPTSSFHL